MYHKNNNETRKMIVHDLNLPTAESTKDPKLIKTTAALEKKK